MFRKNQLQYPTTLKTSLVQEKISFSNKWNVVFDKNYGEGNVPVVFDRLDSWTRNDDPNIKYYSGSATYKNIFFIKNISQARRVQIQFDSICNIATVKINGINCGTLWTPPYQLNITKAIKEGENKIEIEVTNTWHNRLIGDNLLSPEKRITWTTAPFRLKDKSLLPAGIIGDVKIIIR